MMAGVCDPSGFKEKDDSQRRPAVLLVEDTEENRMVIHAFLRVSGCRLENAENGAEAVEKFMNDRFDVVLMDIQMPVMDGFEATRIIRAWEAEYRKGSQVPIVALTAHAAAQELRKGMDVGCNLILTKPIRKQQLLDAIGQWIGCGQG
ncbi:MAG: hypothetical protein HW380_3316 [Magnetococcales bacterium]|nr:hypothetical protein [Magnetococcales bacterium]HIJ84513.1 response regulator [Magnetococcales bacterium]